MTISVELLMALVGVLASVFKAFKFVQEGELGIKLRFGRALKNKDKSPRIIQPGFVLLIPFVESLKRHHVRQQTLRLDHQKVMIAQGLIFNISAVVIFRVKDIYRALFEIDDLDNSLIDLSMGILRDVLSSKDYMELANMATISEELLHKLQEKAEEWGASFIQFKLTDCSPTAETAPLVNAGAGVKMKMEALKIAATEMGVDFTTIPPILAATLVGTPLVASVSSDNLYQDRQQMAHQGKKEKKSLFPHEKEDPETQS